jgi:WD40 repeat protein
VIGSIEPGTRIFVRSAPRCIEGAKWWNVTYYDPTSTEQGHYRNGWTIQEQGWLQPHPETLAAPVNAPMITPENISQLQAVAQIEYGMPQLLEWSPDSSHLAIKTVGAIWLHNLSTGELPVRLLPYQGIATDETHSLSFNPTGDALAAAGLPIGDTSGTLFNAWSLNGEPTLNMEGSLGDYGNYSVVSPDLSLLAGSESNGDITIWDTSTGEIHTVLKGHNLGVWMVFSPDNRYLISKGGAGMTEEDMTMRIWDVATGTQLAIFEDMDNLITEIPFSPDGRYFAAALQGHPGDVGQIHVYDLDNLTSPPAVFPFEPARALFSLTFSSDGDSLVMLTAERIEPPFRTNTALFIDLASGEQADVPLPFLDFEVLRAAFSPDGRLLATVRHDPDFWGPDRVTLWSVVQ